VRKGLPSQNRRLVSSDHGPKTSNSAARPAIACSARSPIPRTVADGTDTNTKIDRARRPRTSAPTTPIGATAYLADLDRAADQIGGSGRIDGPCADDQL
jgi:hypothetical protein